MKLKAFSVLLKAVSLYFHAQYPRVLATSYFTNKAYYCVDSRLQKKVLQKKKKVLHENYEELTHKCMQSGSIFHA